MKAKKTDANQQQIVKDLRKCGYTVFITSMVGNGFPDLTVGAHGLTFLFEVKDGTKYKSCQKLTNLENLFHLTWKGQASIITSAQQAIDIIAKTIVK